MTFAISIALMKKYRTSSKGCYSRVKKINADPKQYFLLIKLKTDGMPSVADLLRQRWCGDGDNYYHYSALWNCKYYRDCLSYCIHLLGVSVLKNNNTLKLEYSKV